LNTKFLPVLFSCTGIQATGDIHVKKGKVVSSGSSGSSSSGSIKKSSSSGSIKESSSGGSIKESSSGGSIKESSSGGSHGSSASGKYFWVPETRNSNSSTLGRQRFFLFSVRTGDSSSGVGWVVW
jgi:hypothetical protein